MKKNKRGHDTYSTCVKLTTASTAIQSTSAK